MDDGKHNFETQKAVSLKSEKDDRRAAVMKIALHILIELWCRIHKSTFSNKKLNLPKLDLGL